MFLESRQLPNHAVRLDSAAWLWTMCVDQGRCGEQTWTLLLGANYLPIQGTMVCVLVLSVLMAQNQAAR